MPISKIIIQSGRMRPTASINFKYGYKYRVLRDLIANLSTASREDLLLAKFNNGRASFLIYKFDIKTKFINDHFKWPPQHFNFQRVLQKLVLTFATAAIPTSPGHSAKDSFCKGSLVDWSGRKECNSNCRRVKGRSSRKQSNFRKSKVWKWFKTISKKWFKGDMKNGAEHTRWKVAFWTFTEREWSARSRCARSDLNRSRPRKCSRKIVE